MSCSSGMAEGGGERQGPLPCESRSQPLRELQKGLSSQGRCSLAAGEVWLLRERFFWGGVLGTKGVEVIHRTEQLQKKAGVLVESHGERDSVKQHEWLRVEGTKGESLEKKQCLASFRRASRALFAWLGPEGLLVIAATAHTDSANF